MRKDRVGGGSGKSRRRKVAERGGSMKRKREREGETGMTEGEEEWLMCVSVPFYVSSCICIYACTKVCVSAGYSYLHVHYMYMCLFVCK